MYGWDDPNGLYPNLSSPWHINYDAWSRAKRDDGLSESVCSGESLVFPPFSFLDLLSDLVQHFAPEIWLVCAKIQ